jgi:hypothetical protein
MFFESCDSHGMVCRNVRKESNIVEYCATNELREFKDRILEQLQDCGPSNPASRGEPSILTAFDSERSTLCAQPPENILMQLAVGRENVGFLVERTGRAVEGCHASAGFRDQE